MALLKTAETCRCCDYSIIFNCNHIKKIVLDSNIIHTGRFVMYSGITKIYYRKTVGHVFTKPVQIEGTTQKIFFPVSCFSS